MLLSIDRHAASLLPHSEFHRELSAFNRLRLSPALPSIDWKKKLQTTFEFSEMEEKFLEREREKIASMMGTLPQCLSEFMEWFDELLSRGPGQNDPLFDWLATEASEEQMRWFIAQEVAGEAGFDDLVALTQIKLPLRPKLEMARNFWDEMGRGSEIGMHGPMLARLASEFSVERFAPEEIVIESLALSNLLIAFASNRSYAFHSVGALGAIELTAPGRALQVLKGLERLGYPQAAQYYRLHSVLDVKHSQAWNHEVILPLISEKFERAFAIAEGAWLRLEFGARCFKRYREQFGI